MFIYENPRVINEIKEILIKFPQFSGVGTVVGLPLLKLAVSIGLKQYELAFKVASNRYEDFETNGAVLKKPFWYWYRFIFHKYLLIAYFWSDSKFGNEQHNVISGDYLQIGLSQLLKDVEQKLLLEMD